MIYKDVCTFPDEFCDSEERRCSPCSRAVCTLRTAIPLACNFTCTGWGDDNTNTEIDLDNQDSKIWKILTAILGLVVVCLMIILCVCACRRNKRRDSKLGLDSVEISENNTTNEYEGVNQDETPEDRHDNSKGNESGEYCHQKLKGIPPTDGDAKADRTLLGLKTLKHDGVTD
ncbi:hypothetical protein MAR_030170 [Mya arenaria]|uniref:Uncharacterized protein n=1 Tax=Mya arenaria TaxID=6604 RepID=A0ABY7DM97_MYAAR|nr:hypothetical protein MAR_030170 [Mya arenaria]